MSEPLDIKRLLDSSRAAAEQAGMDPDSAKDSSDAIHSAAANTQSPFEVWSAIDVQIGKEDIPDLQRQLIKFRSCFESELFAAQTSRIEKALQQGPDVGWNYWLTIVAEAITSSRLGFAMRLSERDFPFSESHKEAAKNISKAIHCLYQERWAEAYDQLDYLASQDFLPPVTRAILIVVLASIQLGQFSRVQVAKAMFDTAEKLAPDDGKVLSALGRYWAMEDDDERARSYYQRSINVAPGLANGYTAMGESFEKEEQFKTAEEWYLKAIESAPGDSAGYQQLFKLYGQREFFEHRQRDLLPIVERAIAVCPEDEYSLYLDLGSLYEQNHNFEEAQKWYRTAIALDESRPGGYIATAQCFEKEQQNDKAEAAYKRAIEVAPECCDGYFGLTAFYAQQEKWQDAIEWCKRVPGHMRAVSGIRHNVLGNLHYSNGEYDKAVEQYRLATAASPSAIFSRNLAGAYKELKKYPEARRELEAAFKLDDDKKTFDGETSLVVNAQGNDYYAQGNYEKAIERYQEALKFDSSNDVIHSNLGGAWELSKAPVMRLEALDEALKAFTLAQEIKASEKYETAIERLKLKKEFALACGEKVLDLVSGVTPIVIEIGLDLIPHITDDVEHTSSALSADLANQLTSLRARVQNAFGVEVPGIQFKDNLTGLSGGGYAILLAEVPVVSGNVLPDRFFCNASAETLSMQGIIGSEAINPVTGGEGCWIKAEDRPGAKASNLELWTCMEFVIRHLAAVVERNLTEFLGHQEVAQILEKESRKALEEMRTATEKLSALTAVCRALVEERVPIKAFGVIFEVFNRLYSKGTNLQDIVENIRPLPQFSPALRGNDEQHSLLPLGPRFEADLRNAIYQSNSHPVLAIEPENCQTALTLFRNSIGASRDVAVVVEDAALRPFIRLFEIEFPNLAVLSRRELRTDIEFHTLAPAELDGETPSTKPEFKSSNQIDPADSALATEAQAEIAGSEEVGITVFVNQILIAEPGNADDLSIDEMFSKLQDGFFSELGIILPQVRLEIDNTLKSNQFRFRLNNREYQPSVGLESNEFLVNDVVDRLKLLKIEGKEATNPANGNKCAIVREEKGSSATCRQAGLTTWGPAGFLVLFLSAEIRKHAADFQTNKATQYILSVLRSLYPELVKVALNRFTVGRLSLILKDLLNEEISIRDLRRILESLLSINGTTDVDLHRYIVFAPPAESLCPVTGGRDIDRLTIADYSDFVRTSLKRYISHKYTKGANALSVYLLDVKVEERLSNLGGQPLMAEENRLLAAVKSELQSLPATSQNPVILTTPDIRRTVKRVVESVFPGLAVLSYQELSPDMSIQPIGRITWAEDLLSVTPDDDSPVGLHEGDLVH